MARCPQRSSSRGAALSHSALRPMHQATGQLPMAVTPPASPTPPAASSRWCHIARAAGACDHQALRRRIHSAPPLPEAARRRPPPTAIVTRLPIAWAASSTVGPPWRPDTGRRRRRPWRQRVPRWSVSRLNAQRRWWPGTGRAARQEVGTLAQAAHRTSSFSTTSLACSLQLPTRRLPPPSARLRRRPGWSARLTRGPVRRHRGSPLQVLGGATPQRNDRNRRRCRWRRRARPRCCRR